jgi:membrane protease YdiL (CAAX protease family)
MGRARLAGAGGVHQQYHARSTKKKGTWPVTALATAPTPAAPVRSRPATPASDARALRPVAWFVLLAYGWTWGLLASAWLLLRAGAVSEATAGLLGDVAGFGPTVAALVAAAALGRSALTWLLASLFRWRVSPGWYLVALYGPALVAVAGAAAWFGPGALAYDRLWPAVVTRYVPVALLTLLTAGPIQEELGWRGFALPRLQARLRPAAGTAVLGAVWAAWHLPNAVFRGWDGPTTALFLLATVLTAFPYTWLANHTRGSVPLAMLLHAGINTSTRLVSTLVPESALAGFETTIYAVLSLAYAVLAATLLAATRGRLAAPPTTTASAPAPVRGSVLAARSG